MKIEGHPSATSTILSYNLHVTAPDALSQLCCGRTQYIAKRRKSIHFWTIYVEVWNIKGLFLWVTLAQILRRNGKCDIFRAKCSCKLPHSDTAHAQSARATSGQILKDRTVSTCRGALASPPPPFINLQIRKTRPFKRL